MKAVTALVHAKNISDRKSSERIIFHARSLMDEVDIPFDTNM